MNGFAIRQQNHPEEAVMHLWNPPPASDAPVALHDLANWRPDSPLDPFVFDYGPIGARPDGREVGRHLHRFTLSELEAATKTLNEQSTIAEVTHRKRMPRTAAASSSFATASWITARAPK